jgi:transglutaminase-like putative cysteine protease
MNTTRYTLLTLVLLILIGATTNATPGDTVRSITLTTHHPHGLTFDGTHLWLVDHFTDYLYQIDTATGNVRDSIKSPAYHPRGLTFDGTWLWCVDSREETIFAINPVTRVVERTIWCAAGSPNGLAFDGQWLWIVDDASDELHRIDNNDGTTISSIKAPTPNPMGLTFDGTCLWVSDRYRDKIFMVHPTSGDVILTLNAPGKHPWGLAWDGKHLWNVDYQSDRVYQIVVHDTTRFDRTEQKDQQLTFVHQVRNFGPDSVRTLDVYLAVPHDMPNQTLLSEPVFAPPPRQFLTDKWGQRVAHFSFADMAAGEFTTVTMTNNVRLFQNRYYIFPDRVGTLNDIPAEIKNTYLANDAKFDYEHEVIRTAVRKAVGDETNAYWIARKIYNYVIEHIEYELAGGWNVAPTVLERGTGSCSEYTFVYIAMCRAAGLPARYVGSVVVRNDDASHDRVFHRWVEVYLPGYEWVPVDPSGGDSPWPATRADYFGFLANRFLITTSGGGGSEFLEWSYNANERWTSVGRCKIEAENFGEWTPLELNTDTTGH